MRTSNKIMIKRTDVEIANLKGQVKQIKQVCYKAEEVDGNIIPGEIVPDRNKTENYLRTYNEKGAKIYEHHFYEYSNHVTELESSESIFKNPRAVDNGQSLEANKYSGSYTPAKSPER